MVVVVVAAAGGTPHLLSGRCLGWSARIEPGGLPCGTPTALQALGLIRAEGAICQALDCRWEMAPLALLAPP